MTKKLARMHKPNIAAASPHVSFSMKSTDLAASEITIAKLLKQKGYATGYVGKWNLSSSPDVFPDMHGFDYSYYFDGALSRYVDDPVDTSRYINMHLPWAFSEIPAWAPRYGSTAIKEGRAVVKDTGYLTFSLAEKGIDFIERNKTNPFFLTLSFNAPHDPFQVWTFIIVGLSFILYIGIAIWTRAVSTKDFYVAGVPWGIGGVVLAAAALRRRRG